MWYYLFHHVRVRTNQKPHDVTMWLLAWVGCRFRREGRNRLFSEVVGGDRHMSYNYNSSSFEVQPLLDLKPIESEATARRVRASGGMAARAADPLTPYHISAQSKITPVVRTDEERFSPPKMVPGVAGSVSIWVDGSIMQAKSPRVFVRGRKGVYKRGRIVGFSNGSRRRQMRMLAKLRSDARPLFVTLTYPGEFSPNPSQWKRDLRKLEWRFRRKFPLASAIWRLEPQKRLAPHYHLLVYGVVFCDEVGQWFRRSWYECVASGDGRHLAYGVDIQPIRSARGVRSYVSKYIAKKTVPADVDEDDPEYVDWSSVGRWWGVWCSENLPWSEVITAVGLLVGQSVKLQRAMRRFLKSRGVHVSGVLPGLTMFTEAPRQWFAALDGLMGGHYDSGGSFLHLEGFT